MAIVTGRKQFIEAPVSTTFYPKLSRFQVTLESDVVWRSILESTERSGHAARQWQGEQRGPG